MRKIHDAYEKLRNPWYRRPKTLTAVFILLSALIGMSFLGLEYLGEKNRERTLDVIDRAFAGGDIQQASRTIRMALESDPADEGLQVQYARLLSRLEPRAAVGAWKSVLEQTQESEHAVAYALAAISIGDFESAEEAVSFLDNNPQAASAYHRAAYSLSFARGNDPEAYFHLERILELEPDSADYRFDHARLGARSLDVEVSEKAIAELWEHVETAQGSVRNEAARALAQAYVYHSDSEGLKRTLAAARDPKRNPPASNFLWALEAEHRLNPALDVEGISDVWTQSLSQGDESTWLRLITWMNAFGYADLAIKWATARPSQSVWRFPSGMLLADSAFRSDQTEAVLEGLKGADWQDRDFLRLLIISRIEEYGTGRRFWLEQAFDAAESVTGGGGRLLIPILRTWGWIEAETETYVRLLSEVKIRPSELADLLTRLEDQESWLGMYRLSRALARAFPENAALKNNAAYLAVLNGRDFGEAEAWIEEILLDHASVPEFRSTAALVYAEMGEISKARSILEGLDKDFGALARVAIERRLGAEGDLQRLISETQWTSLNSLEKKWLGMNDKL